MARTARKKLAIYADGVLLSDDANSIDFTGGGVSGSVDMDGNVTENIPGGGSGGSIAFETPVGLINDSNVTFTVSNVPLYIVLNGSTYFEGDGYTLSGLTITMLITPQTGSTLRSAYE